MKKLNENHPVLGEISNDRYNNGVTYHDAWNTPENKKWHEILEKKYLDRPQCSSDCPVSWSREVFELLEKLDKEFGIQYNTSTVGGYSIRGDLYTWFIVEPLKSVTVHHLEYLLRKNFSDNRKWIVRHWPDKLSDRLKSFPKRIFDSIIGLFSYYRTGLIRVKVVYINKLLNRLLGKKIELSQVKEKYGSLTIYYSTPDYLSEYVENQIRRTKVKLSLKGAYVPLSNLWNSNISWACGTEYHPDEILVKKSESGTTHVTQTTYRKILKDMLPKEEFDKLKENAVPLSEEG